MPNEPVTADTPYPSKRAMEAAVRIEFNVACGGVTTETYGKIIQQAMDDAVAELISPVKTK